MDLIADLNQNIKHSLTVVSPNISLCKSSSSRESMMSGTKSAYNYMFHKPKDPSNMYVSRAYFRTGEGLLEGFMGCSCLSALLIVGSCPVSYNYGVIAPFSNSFPESFMQTRPVLPKQSNPSVSYVKPLNCFSKVSLIRMIPVTEKGRIFHQALVFTIKT